MSNGISYQCAMNDVLGRRCRMILQNCRIDELGRGLAPTRMCSGEVPSFKPHVHLDQAQ